MVIVVGGWRGPGIINRSNVVYCRHWGRTRQKRETSKGSLTLTHASVHNAAPTLDTLPQTSTVCDVSALQRLGFTSSTGRQLAQWISIRLR